MRKQVGDYTFRGDLPTIIKAIEAQAEGAGERDRQTLLQYREWLVVDGGTQREAKRTTPHNDARSNRRRNGNHKRRNREHGDKAQPTPNQTS